MSQIPDGDSHADGPEPGDEDPDSLERSGFFARWFGRDTSEDETQDRADEDPVGTTEGAREMLVNLRNLRNMRLDDVCVPRAEIVAVSDEASIEEVLELFQNSTFSRLPVYSESLDQPIGLIHLKDLALKHGFGASADDFDLRALVRPLLYAPPSMRIGVLLQKMQAARMHMALVIDEYGGVDGLVTLEDLLEQVVGDIADEHDEAESLLWSREADGVYLVQSRMDLDDFEAETGVRLSDPEYRDEMDTVGGLVIQLAGRVPVRGEVVMHPEGHEFEVTDADARKINRIRVRMAPGAAQHLTAEAAE